MARIKSNVNLVYDARKQASGTIVIEISEWKYDLKHNRYIAKVDDFHTQIEMVEEEEIEVLVPISSKEVKYDAAQIDGLFYALQNPIDLTESYTSEMDYLISQALLYVTQQDPVYGSAANNWILA